MAYVRTVKTSSGATAVQVVWSSRRGSRNIEHIGSAHDDAELEALKAAARQRLAAGQPNSTSDWTARARRAAGDHLDADGPPAGRPVRAYDALGFPQATGHDEVFRQLVLARIIEPASKQDSLRVLEEAGAARAVVSHAQPAPARLGGGRLAARPVRGVRGACQARPGILVLYDVSTLYFETDQGDGFQWAHGKHH